MSARGLGHVLEPSSDELTDALKGHFSASNRRALAKSVYEGATCRPAGAPGRSRFNIIDLGATRLVVVRTSGLVRNGGRWSPGRAMWFERKQPALAGRCGVLRNVCNAAVDLLEHPPSHRTTNSSASRRVGALGEVSDVDIVRDHLMGVDAGPSTGVRSNGLTRPTWG
ncbi:MAG: hypothetical protein CM15mP128_3450 [Methanobacteriota archaeon]|nr:MAG: hypothetical protein CM15mP128_3450 [Euryarchaeota archaeon]